MFSGKKSNLLLLLFFVFNVASAASPELIKLNKAANSYIDEFYLPTHPTLAAELGVHRYDGQLEDYSHLGIQNEIKQLKQYKVSFESINATDLDLHNKINRELILNDINSQLLSLETIRDWQKNPDFYATSLTNAAFVIMERPYAPASERLQSLIEREKKMPAMLQAAKKNLKNPPKIYTEIALQQLPGMINFFQKDVPLAFSEVDNQDIQQAFRLSNQHVISALKSYQQWLKKDLLPRSKGSFRLGRETFRRKLKYDEMVDMPLRQLLALGMQNLHDNQRDYHKVLKELAGKKSAKSVGQAIKSDYPPPAKLLKTFSSTFDSLINFVNENDIITIPEGAPPVMEQTPPFMRAITLASMDPPGPFEKKNQHAYFNVTLPEKGWSKSRVKDYMGTFNYPAIKDTAIHEAYPGHYVQLLWINNSPDRVRKIFGARTNIEGWAHYCEQMMIEEGYGAAAGKRQALMMRLGQLQFALLRNARFIVAIKMHTEKMSIDDAVNFFIKEGYQPRPTAIIEAKRGTEDPTYLYYTLGKLQILQLREEMKQRLGDQFNLRAFHDAFMRQGFPPIRLVRQALLSENAKLV